MAKKSKSGEDEVIFLPSKSDWKRQRLQALAKGLHWKLNLMNFTTREEVITAAEWADEIAETLNEIEDDDILPPVG